MKEEHKRENHATCERITASEKRHSKEMAECKWQISIVHKQNEVMADKNVELVATQQKSQNRIQVLESRLTNEKHNYQCDTEVRFCLRHRGFV